jgi:hypothetical protein
VWKFKPKAFYRIDFGSWYKTVGVKSLIILEIEKGTDFWKIAKLWLKNLILNLEYEGTFLIVTIVGQIISEWCWILVTMMLTIFLNYVMYNFEKKNLDKNCRKFGANIFMLRCKLVLFPVLGNTGKHCLYWCPQFLYYIINKFE